jgi:hypothetical protein
MRVTYETVPADDDSNEFGQLTSAPERPITYGGEHMEFTTHTIPCPERPGARVVYGSAAGTHDELQPMLYVAGFSDVAYGFDNKMGLADRLAGHGLGMIIAQNHRDRILRHLLTGKPDAMYTQAASVLAAVENEGLADTTLPTTAHSMGGVVLATAVAEAKRRGWTCFDKAPVVLLASAGLNERENGASLVGRYTSGLAIDQLKRAGRQNLDPGVVSEGAFQRSVANGFRSAAASLSLSRREIGELAHKRIKVAALANSVGFLAVGIHGQDPVMGHRFVDRTMAKIMADPDTPSNLAYFTLYSTKLARDGKPLGIRNAHHADCITCPTRVADAIAPFLRYEVIAPEA